MLEMNNSSDGVQSARIDARNALRCSEDTSANWHLQSGVGTGALFVVGDSSLDVTVLVLLVSCQKQVYWTV